jgi:hypothetical protein
MLEKLRLLLIEQKTVLCLDNPMRGFRISQGLHQLQLVMFLVQIVVLLVLVLFAKSSGSRVLVSNWFLIIGISLVVFMAVFSERAFREEPSFLALLRLCILTSVSSAIPAMLGTLAWLFEGLTWGVLGLFGSSLVAFVVCWSRLTLLAGLVPQILEPMAATPNTNLPMGQDSGLVTTQDFIVSEITKPK